MTLRAARFVIRTKQRRAVRRDDVIADQVLEVRIFRDSDDLRLVIRQNNIAALIVFDDIYLYIGPRNRWRSVHVSHKSDSWHVGIAGQIRRHHAVNNTEFAHTNILHTKLLQLLLKQPRQIELLLRRRHRILVLRRLRVDLHITKEAVHRGLGRPALLGEGYYGENENSKNDKL